MMRGLWLATATAGTAPWLAAGDTGAATITAAGETEGEASVAEGAQTNYRLIRKVTAPLAADQAAVDDSFDLNAQKMFESEWVKRRYCCDLGKKYAIKPGNSWGLASAHVDVQKAWDGNRCTMSVGGGTKPNCDTADDLRQMLTSLPKDVEPVRPANWVNSTYSQFLREVYGPKTSPYNVFAQPGGVGVPPDHGFAWSNLNANIVQNVVKHHERGVSFWLELGSYIGNSAIMAARALRSLGLNSTVVAMDPWTGDVNAWALNKDKHETRDTSVALGLEDLQRMGPDGISRVYETFLANVHDAKLDEMIMPVRTTAMVGMRLVKRLHESHRIKALPDVIYLDSAHEANETLMEVEQAWKILPPGGVLMGDDWGWLPVKEDVTQFLKSQKLEKLSAEDLQKWNTPEGKATQPVDGLILIEGSWILRKAKAAE